MEQSAINVDFIEDILLEKLAYQNKFCQKIIKMVKDVESEHEEENQEVSMSSRISDRGQQVIKKDLPNLQRCWQWVKGLLYDFVKIKTQFEKNQKSTDKLKKKLAVQEDLIREMKKAMAQ